MALNNRWLVLVSKSVPVDNRSLDFPGRDRFSVFIIIENLQFFFEFGLGKPEK